MLQRRMVFQAFDASWTSLAVVAVVIAAAALVVLLSRYERKLVPAPVGYGLLLLRLCVIATLWIALLQPVMTWSVDRERTGRVIVSLDVSESMTTADKIATPAEKFRTAIGLGMIGNDQNHERTLRWLADFEAEREPTWVDENETADAEKRQQLARTRKEFVSGVFREIERLPRAEIARRLLSDKPDSWLNELKKAFVVELRVFGGKSLPSELETLAETVQKPPEGVSANVTSLVAALDASAADQQSPVRAIVVLTDGRETSGSDAIATARRWKDLNAAIYPILVGSERRPKDIVLDTIDVPPSVYLNDKPLAKVTLQAAGFEGETLTVVLEELDGKTLTKSVTVPKPESGLPPAVAVEFALDATKLGRHQFIVKTDVLKAETRDDNNARDFSLTVIDDKAKVLLVEGESRWEFRFLDSAFSRDERVRFERVLFEQPFMGILGETFYPRRLNFGSGEGPIEKSPLAEFDLVVIGDVSPRDLPEPVLMQLDKFVSDIGGTVIFIAGKRHMPQQYRSATLDNLLPLSNPKVVSSLDPPTTPPHLRGFHLRLTPDGERDSTLQMAGDAETNRTTWKSLPGHPWAMIGDVKPGATVLATADDGQPLPPEMEKARALVVQQFYGLGQVLWLGFDSTWRWRHRVGDQHHHRFWGQLARTAAQNKATAGNEFVRFGLEATDIQSGQDVVFRARWTPQTLARRPGVKGKVAIFPKQNAKPDEPVATIDLLPDPTRPAQHQGRWLAPSAGEYRAVLKIDGPPLGGAADKEVAAEFQVRGPLTKELGDVTATRAILDQIAQASNGRVMLPQQLGELPKLIHPEDLKTTESFEHTLWDHWLLMALLFSLLTGEWVLRKWNGLP
ncbi:MAG: hypothetical protein NT013_26400 [Planctomycetia bacterium]|nr:hypothetical protein [Planctomycetia bacterium]